MILKLYIRKVHTLNLFLEILSYGLKLTHIHVGIKDTFATKEIRYKNNRDCVFTCDKQPLLRFRQETVAEFYRDVHKIL